MVYFILFYAALGVLLILVIVRMIKNRKGGMLATETERWFEISPGEIKEKIRKAVHVYGKAVLHLAALYTIKSVRFLANKSRAFFRQKAHQVLSKLNDYETTDRKTPREMSSFMRDMHEHKRKVNGDGDGIIKE